MAMIINVAMIITMAVVNAMPSRYPNPSVATQAQFGRVVANLFHQEGWKVVEEPREKNVAPDFLVSGRGKKFVVELKRASEGRKDRVIPLLSQAALEAAHYSRVMHGHPLPLAIVAANRIPESVAEEAKQFVRERAPEVAVGLLDLEGLRLFAGHGLESLSSARHPQSAIRAPNVRARAPQLFSDLNQWMLKVLLAPRIPDGEQLGWVLAAFQSFGRNPALAVSRKVPLQAKGRFPIDIFRLRPGFTANDLTLGPYGYAANAAKSYAQFRELKGQGKILPGTRFAVTLPGPGTSAYVIEVPAEELLPIGLYSYRP